MRRAGYFALLFLALGSAAAFAVDSGAVIGGAIGGATGAAVGDAVGGRNGAILGAAVGGATGAAIGSKDSKQVQAAPVQTVRAVEGDRNEHRDNGRHLGERKHKNKHKHYD